MGFLYSKKVVMKSFSISLLLLIVSVSGFSQVTKYCNNNGIAIRGYDPVAYFLVQKPVEGSDAYTLDWSGSKWKFISQANLDSFTLAPLKYAPQYGGYCAYGVSENHTSPTDPKAWTIVNDKLYLNYSLEVKEYWLKDTVSRIKTANEYWPSLNK